MISSLYIINFKTIFVLGYWSILTLKWFYTNLQLYQFHLCELRSIFRFVRFHKIKVHKIKSIFAKTIPTYLSTTIWHMPEQCCSM